MKHSEVDMQIGKRDIASVHHSSIIRVLYAAIWPGFQSINI